MGKVGKEPAVFNYANINRNSHLHKIGLDGLKGQIFEFSAKWRDKQKLPRCFS